VIRAGHLKQQQPRELLEAQPRAPLDPRSGPIWRKVTVGERDYWVNKRFRKELAALDENLRGAAEPPVPASTGS
jgi:hypothetical protein